MGIKEAAQYLGMSVAWMYAHVEGKRPRVPVVRMGGSLRFCLEDLDEFLKEQRALSAARRPSGK